MLLKMGILAHLAVKYVTFDIFSQKKLATQCVLGMPLSLNLLNV